MAVAVWRSIALPDPLKCVNHDQPRVRVFKNKILKLLY